MIKNTLLALVATASILGAAVPAFAGNNPSGESYEALDDNSGAIVSVLQTQGINATDVEDWGTQVRAYVTLEDGRQVFQYFDADSLQPVTSY